MDQFDHWVSAYDLDFASLFVLLALFSSVDYLFLRGGVRSLGHDPHLINLDKYERIFLMLSLMP